MVEEMTDELTSSLFSTAEMTRIFSPASQLRAMMRFEWALACALESNGVAAAGLGAALEKLLDASFVDQASLREKALDAGNIVIPFLHQLTRKTEETYGSGCCVHLGATSQDVLDTALVLQMREALDVLFRAIDRLDAALSKQVREHAETVLTGRTWLQAGPPTTLGLKLAATLAAIRRHRLRLRAAAERALFLQFGGAVGTLAALGDAGAGVSRTLAEKLELPEPDMPWHTRRDDLVEVAAVLALLTGSLGKFAKDVALLMQPEVGEVSEPLREGRGSSSTMPQKRNPVACATVLACAERVPGLVATLLTAMPQEHERGLGLWQAEWETLPQIFRLTAAALDRSVEIAEGLVVNAAQMLANLKALRGLNMAEAVSIALAQKLGRAPAHEMLRRAAERAHRENCSLREVLKRTPEVTAHLSEDEIDRLMNPRAYLGSSQRFIARVLEAADADR
jgi:3-carboxy-cis,cis-muconate cycloisomerase